MSSHQQHGQRVQMTLEMRPADIVPSKRPERVARKWIIRDKAANLVDQLSMLTGRPKQSIVDDAIRIVAILYSEDPDKIKEILTEFYPDDI
ncbi:MAG: hypothetical protein AB7E75_03465 [Candidatus Methanomethylophilaceae archaeon]